MPSTPAPEGLFARLYFDRHVIGRLADDLRAQGYDVLRTEEAGLDTATDEEQLALAAREGRALLTFNIRDFAPLHATWQAAGRRHAGIVVSRQMGGREYAPLRRRLLRLLNEMTADEIADNLVHLE